MGFSGIVLNNACYSPNYAAKTGHVLTILTMTITWLNEKQLFSALTVEQEEKTKTKGTKAFSLSWNELSKREKP